MLTVSIPNEIKSLLEEKLINTGGKIDYIYKWLDNHFKKEYFLQQDNKIESIHLDVAMFSDFFSILKEKKIRTIGIDFPIYLSKGGNKPTLMVCALDPLRNEIENKNPTTKVDFWVPFSIINNPINQTKHSEKENLTFFHTLLNSYNLYITDIYKIFYREGNMKSNSLTDFKSLLIHKEMLENEIKIMQPDAILTLGNNTRDIISNLYNLNPPKWSDEVFITNLEEELKIVMIPHISGAARGASTPIKKNPKYKNITGRNNEKYANIVLNVLKK